MARTGKLSPEARDDHYREFDRLLGPPPASGQRRFRGACPPPSQITVPEEMLWLTVMLAQMRWPWPQDIKNALADLPHSSRFSVEQARYLLRHDPELTALHAAKAGALIAGWPADLAAKALLEMARQRQSPAADELSGRWPLPTGSERRQWEKDKNTFFRERHRHLTRDEKVAWLCLAYGQMGWPLPSLLTRFFPIDWTRRKMDSALLANIFNTIGVADAVIADVQIKGLNRAGVLDAADNWASFERSREAEAKAGGIPAFVMFRDKLPRAGPQGRLYRQLFDQAQTVLQSEGQQPGERLQLLDFLNRQTAVDEELARQKSVTDAAGDQGAHLGVRVSPPPAQSTAPKLALPPSKIGESMFPASSSGESMYPLPKNGAGSGIVYAKPDDSGDDDVDSDSDSDDDFIDHEDDDEGSATEGITHELPGETSSGSSRNKTEKDVAEATENVPSDQLTRTTDGARETTHDDGAAKRGEAASGDLPQAAEQLQRSPSADGLAPAETITAVDVVADPIALNHGSLTGMASHVRRDIANREVRPALIAHDAGQTDSGGLQRPPASENERTAGYGHFPGGSPSLREQTGQPGDRTDQSVDEAFPIDEDWDELTNPRYSFRKRRRQTSSANIPADGRQDRAPVGAPDTIDENFEDISSPQSSLRNRLPLSSEPSAGVVIGGSEEASENSDRLGSFGADDRTAGSEMVSQPVAFTPVVTWETAGSTDEVVTSHDLLAPAHSQPAEAWARAAGENNDKNDGDETPASTPVTSLPSGIGDAKRSEAQRLNVPGEEEPRHEAAHPLAVHRAYRHDVVQTKGSKQSRGYEVERISVRLDDRDDPA